MSGGSFLTTSHHVKYGVFAGNGGRLRHSIDLLAESCYHIRHKIAFILKPRRVLEIFLTQQFYEETSIYL